MSAVPCGSRELRIATVAASKRASCGRAAEGRPGAYPVDRCGAGGHSAGRYPAEAKAGKPEQTEVGSVVEGGLAGRWRERVVVTVRVFWDAATVLKEQGGSQEHEARAERQAGVD